MRLVDDFLLITPDLHEAQTFLKYDTRQVFHTYGIGAQALFKYYWCPLLTSLITRLQMEHDMMSFFI